MYKPNHVANAFLVKAKEDGITDVDPLKIQKLVYFLNGFHLAIFGVPIIGETFEVWPYGPVLDSLYHQFKNYKKGPITGFALDLEDDNNHLVAFQPDKKNKEFYELLERVWNRYKNYNGLQLSALTHADGSPWSKAKQRKESYLNNEEIKQYFEDILK